MIEFMLGEVFTDFLYRAVTYIHIGFYSTILSMYSAMFQLEHGPLFLTGVSHIVSV